MDHKTPLLPSNTRQTFDDDECYRHRRLSKLAIVLSVIALMYTFFSRHAYHRYISSEPCTITTSSSVESEVQSAAALLESTSCASPSGHYWCPRPSESWKMVTSEFTVPSSDYQGLDIQQKASNHVNFQVYCNI